jgi:hypothetical protein
MQLSLPEHFPSSRCGIPIQSSGLTLGVGVLTGVTAVNSLRIAVRCPGISKSAKTPPAAGKRKVTWAGVDRPQATTEPAVAANTISCVRDVHSFH